MKSTALAFILLVAGCAYPSPQDFDAERAATAEAGVRSFLDTLRADLSDRGPLAWLDHFDHGPEFFMASDGIELFPDYPTADSIVRGFAPGLRSIRLDLDDLDVYPHDAGYAQFGSPYRETLVDTSGAEMSIRGYVTGTIVRAAGRWKVRSLHWSSPVPPQY